MKAKWQDDKWIHAAYPSWVGAIGACVSAILGPFMLAGLLWALHIDVPAWLLTFWVLFVPLDALAVATYRKWQNEP